MPNTKHTGDVTEARILHELLRRGHGVSIPFGDNDPYDLVVMVGGELLAIQCKTGWNESGRLRFKTGSKTTVDVEPVVVDYGDEVDVFAVRSRDSGDLYWVPAADTGRKSTYLRLDAPTIDHPSVKRAADYTFDRRLP